jgi:hypothetical protein
VKEQLEPQNAYLHIYTRAYDRITEQMNACKQKMSTYERYSDITKRVFTLILGIVAGLKIFSVAISIRASDATAKM